MNTGERQPPPNRRTRTAVRLFIECGLVQASLIPRPSPLCSKSLHSHTWQPRIRLCGGQRKGTLHYLEIFLKAFKTSSAPSKPVGGTNTTFSSLLIDPWMLALESFSRPLWGPQGVFPSGKFLTVPGDQDHCHLRRMFTLRQALVYGAQKSLPECIRTPKRVTLIFKPRLDPTNIR